MKVIGLNQNHQNTKVVNYIIENVMKKRIFPLTDETESIIKDIDLFELDLGENIPVTSRWYNNGGTFCSLCNIRYSYIESLIIYIKQTMDGVKRLPRCPECSSQLRTKPTSNREMVNTFWNRLDELKSPIEIKSWGI